MNASLAEMAPVFFTSVSPVSGRPSAHESFVLNSCSPDTFRFFVFRYLFFGASAWHRKPPQVCSSVVVYTPRHAKTSSHSHPQKQSLGLQHNKALACIHQLEAGYCCESYGKQGSLRLPACSADSSLPEPPTEDGHVGHVSRGEQKA